MQTWLMIFFLYVPFTNIYVKKKVKSVDDSLSLPLAYSYVHYFSFHPQVIYSFYTCISKIKNHQKSLTSLALSFFFGVFFFCTTCTNVYRACLIFHYIWGIKKVLSGFDRQLAQEFYTENQGMRALRVCVLCLTL